MTIVNVTNLDPSVNEFIEYIWIEAVGNLEELFGCKLDENNCSKLLTIEKVYEQSFHKDEDNGLLSCTY
jgi:hypothetical protein